MKTIKRILLATTGISVAALGIAAVAQGYMAGWAFFVVGGAVALLPVKDDT